MDEINLERAALYADSNRGQFIPQYFATTVQRDRVTGVTAEDWKVLEAGPDHENYFDVWADVLDNASIEHPTLGKCYLHHDCDLWIVPEDTK